MRVLLAGLLALAGGCSSSDGQAGGVRLNELLALSDTQDDWLELYNTSDSDVSLSGFVLQDSSNYWTVPQITLRAGSFLQIICDGSGVGARASFKLTSKGEQLSVKDSAGALLDSVIFPAQTRDRSWGRIPDGTGSWTGLAVPTPGASNLTGLGDGGVRDAGSSSPDLSGGKPTSAACSKNEECLSQVCHRQICVSSYPNNNGEACAGDGQCLSLVCKDGKCAAGTGAAGSACLNSQECASGSCSAGTCAQGASPDAGGDS